VRSLGSPLRQSSGRLAWCRGPWNSILHDYSGCVTWLSSKTCAKLVGKSGRKSARQREFLAKSQQVERKKYDRCNILGVSMLIWSHFQHFLHTCSSLSCCLQLSSCPYPFGCVVLNRLMHDLLLTVLSHLCSLSIGTSILHVIKLNWALETETMVMLYLQARSYIDIRIESFWGAPIRHEEKPTRF
jgi:hypothetical protein